MHFLLLKFREAWTALLAAGVVLMVLFASPDALAQEAGSVSGVILDEAKKPVVGVAVYIKGNQRGTASNVDGRYELSGVKSSDVLVFSMIGMVAQEIPVGSRSVIDVTMAAEDQTINEVVVTGYQVQRKVDLTGSVSNISSSQLMRTMPFSTCLLYTSPSPRD